MKIKTVGLIKKPINFKSMQFRKCEGQMRAVTPCGYDVVKILGEEQIKWRLKKSEELIGGI